MDGYYPATSHEHALSELREGLRDDEGLLTLHGEAGIGKTLIAYQLIESLPEGSRSVLLTHGKLRSRVELLQAILFDIGLPYQEMSEQELRLSLMESCLSHFQQQGRTIVIIDEAHLLPVELMEELRLLSNLEGRNGKAFQVVLIGMPSMAALIESRGLEIFKQRIAVRCVLEPLSLEESADYLLHHVRRCGGRPERLLGEDVLDILSHASRGVPRILNQAANLAFRLAYDAGNSTVDAEAAVEAVSRLGLDETSEEATTLPAMQPAAGFDLLPHALPVSTVSIPLESEHRPTVYVYGGLEEPSEPVREAKTERVWHSAPQRAG